ncbi:MAG: efflux transporter outer membrane subunit [Candidatus Eisenbacteria bacterium]|nr:efflux transporter outer membrane subunit [Candidatus Latescibacterota bacterium]MBD3302782.1 efflux transporter outer membrane subunit [Candidatus Eisenbacteria bacterium]
MRAAVMIRVLLLPLFLVSGCAGWRPAREPEVDPPDRFVQPHAADSLDERSWTRAFGDTTLARLIDEGLSENLSVRQAVARLDRFRAMRAAANATWFPALNLRASVSETGEVGDDPQPSFQAMSLSPYSATLSASYELDLWGELAAGRAAALADQLASERELRSLSLTIAAQIARTYYRIAELEAQRTLLEATVRSYEDSHALVEARYRRGVAPSLDVYQAETNLAGAKAQELITEANLDAAQHALSVLLGRWPDPRKLHPAPELPEATDPIPPGVPADLLQRRPDVRAAYWRLRAADRRAAEAVAARLPGLTLTGTLSGRGEEPSEAFDPDGWIWTAVGELFAPLFDGGRRKANADRADAVYREQAAAYREAILIAVQEVEDALARGRRQRRAVAQYARQVEAADASLRLATDRYLRGVGEYLQVVVAQTSYFNAQRSWIAARRNLLDLRVGLFTSLGGGWNGGEG